LVADVFARKAGATVRNVGEEAETLAGEGLAGRWGRRTFTGLSVVCLIDWATIARAKETVFTVLSPRVARRRRYDTISDIFPNNSYRLDDARNKTTTIINEFRGDVLTSSARAREFFRVSAIAPVIILSKNKLPPPHKGESK
jgi:hypothetical protein